MRLSSQQRIFGYRLLIPSAVIICLVYVYSLVQGILLSMYDYNLMYPQKRHFVGILNFVQILTDDPKFWAFLFHSLIFVSLTVGVSYALGLACALLLNGRFLGRTFFRAVLLLPWVVPFIVAVLSWKVMYNEVFGIINSLLLQLNLVQQPIPWLSSAQLALVSVSLVNIWKSYPFMMVMLLAGLQGISPELYSAAKVDGANTFQLFIYISFPLLKKVSMIATLLMSIWVFNNFQLIFLMTGGGPADTTQVLATYVYYQSFGGGEIGYGAAVGVIMLFILTILGYSYLKYRRS